METIIKYWNQAAGQVHPVYAVVRMKTGEVRTWSLSRAAARNAIYKEWEPALFCVVQMKPMRPAAGPRV